ncbi:hemerythrin [Acidovorax sp. GW101-3H11]|uniref:hemerythrin domain-containing protein n=1 Tax=Acidovorax sp. GW101-3H11 TaxID=1813946 RepID=UPI0007B50EF0|nr:hemerythrin domain-containing protein [Acidovorax sp. GW101-3H11]KZT15862.1 hemerythrin [Acidovorax sp. GW101-3H11]
MAQLEWSDALNLDLPLMDDTHREFVDLLAVVAQADDAHLQPAWQALVEHTDQHFGQEDAWMASTRFASGNCHSMQHRVVLQVMREGATRAAQGDLQVLRVMASELALWFPQHAQSMDAALALHLRRVGFDPATGVVHAPQALPGELIHGCGGATCSDADAGEEPVADGTHNARQAAVA